jgi:uncharacterized protein YdeI (YjbR/CyaY-like superfamily)
MAGDLVELEMADAAAWRRWLEEHHGSSDGVWLTLAKKGPPGPTSLTYDQALDEALCFGWIDGQLAAGQGPTTFRRKFTPRTARSAWSKRNVAIAERLLAEDRMHPSGDAQVERAKADGRWDAAYAGQAASQVPLDLTAALAANPKAAAMFEQLSSQNRYAVLYRIQRVKRADTRKRRIEGFIDQLARGETIYPQRRATD